MEVRRMEPLNLLGEEGQRRLELRQSLSLGWTRGREDLSRGGAKNVPGHRDKYGTLRADGKQFSGFVKIRITLL